MCAHYGRISIGMASNVVFRLFISLLLSVLPFVGLVTGKANPPGQVTLTVTSDVTNTVRSLPKTSFSPGEVAEIFVDLKPPLLSSTTELPNGLRFTGWSGDATGTENPLRLVMDADKTVHARVEPAAEMQIWSGLGASHTAEYPAIAEDGTVYFVTGGALHSLSPDLKTNWVVQRRVGGNPAIGDSGKVYVASPHGDALCVSPDGEIVWEYSSGNPPPPSPWFWSQRIALTADETFYFASGVSSNVYVIKEGVLLQTLPNLAAGAIREQVPVMGPDETLYFPTETGFAAHKPYGTIHWAAPCPQPVAIDAAGRLYSIDGGNIVALDFDGQELWRTPLEPAPTRVLVGEGGKVFASAGDHLVALDTNGVVLWTNAIPGKFVPLADGGAMILEDKSTSWYSLGKLYYFLSSAFHHILPDGKGGDFSTYAGLGWAVWTPVDPGHPIVTESGDVYARSTPRSPSSGLAALHHYKGSNGVARSSWASPLGYRNTGRAIVPAAASGLALVKKGTGWFLENRGTASEATVESSTNLADWETIGSIDGEIPIEPGTGGPRFYRLRTN